MPNKHNTALETNTRAFFLLYFIDYTCIMLVNLRTT